MRDRSKAGSSSGPAWREEGGAVREVERVLEGVDGRAGRVLEGHERDVAVGLVLEHARARHHLLHLLQRPPARQPQRLKPLLRGLAYALQGQLNARRSY